MPSKRLKKGNYMLYSTVVYRPKRLGSGRLSEPNFAPQFPS
jgi:hypothetical protein